MDTLPPLWATCFKIQSPFTVFLKIYFLHLNRISSVSLYAHCLIFFCCWIPMRRVWLYLLYSCAHFWITYFYALIRSLESLFFSRLHSSYLLASPYMIGPSMPSIIFVALGSYLSCAGQPEPGPCAPDTISPELRKIPSLNLLVMLKALRDAVGLPFYGGMLLAYTQIAGHQDSCFFFFLQSCFPASRPPACWCWNYFPLW